MRPSNENPLIVSSVSFGLLGNFRLPHLIVLLQLAQILFRRWKVRLSNGLGPTVYRVSCLMSLRLGRPGFTMARVHGPLQDMTACSCWVCEPLKAGTNDAKTYREEQ